MRHFAKLRTEGRLRALATIDPSAPGYMDGVGSPNVASMSAHCVMHMFFGSARSLTTKSGTPHPRQVAALGTEPSPDGPPNRHDPVALDEGVGATGAGETVKSRGSTSGW